MDSEQASLKDKLVRLADSAADIPPISAALSAGGLVSLLALFGYISNVTKLAAYGVPRTLVSFSTEELLYGTATLFQLPMLSLSAFMQTVYAPDPGKVLAALLGVAAAVATRGPKTGWPPKTAGILFDLLALTFFIGTTFALSVVVFGLACNKAHLMGINSTAANNLYIEAMVLLGCFFIGALFTSVLAGRLFTRRELKAYGKLAGTVFAFAAAASLLLIPVYAGAIQAYYFPLPRVEVAEEAGPNVLLYENRGLMYLFNENTLTTEIYASGGLEEFSLGSFETRRTLSLCYTYDTKSKK